MFVSIEGYSNSPSNISSRMTVSEGTSLPEHYVWVDTLKGSEGDKGMVPYTLEHKIIIDVSSGRLSEGVNEAFKEGWSLSGDMVVIPNHGAYPVTFYRAMTRVRK